jgi:FHA domain-containing protein
MAVDKMKYGSLLVKLPDGRVREYLIEKAEILVGRSPDNDLVIDDPSVSRKHARIMIEGDRASINDANSNGGTYIGSRRVSSMTPSRLFEDQAARIGQVELRYIPPPQEPDNIRAADARPSISSLAPALALNVPPIQLVIVGPDRPIEPGDMATAMLIIENHGMVADDLLVQISGVPLDWLRLSRDRLRLLPNEQGKITLMFQPPHGSEAAAAEYPFTVNIVSREHRTKANAAGTLKILKQQGLVVHLLPVRSRKNFEVRVENRGNSEVQCELSVTDNERQLKFHFERDSIKLEPGQQKSIKLQVSPKAKIKFNDRSPKLLSFNVVANSPDSAQKDLQAAGMLMIQPPRRWGLVFLGLLLILLGAGGLWAYNQYCPQLTFCPSSAKASINSFTATPVELPRSGTVVLSWDVTNADQVQLVQPDVQTESNNGVATYSIDRTTQFTLRATNAGGVIERSITVNVR